MSFNVAHLLLLAFALGAVCGVSWHWWVIRDVWSQGFHGWMSTLGREAVIFIAFVIFPGQSVESIMRSSGSWFIWGLVLFIAFSITWAYHVVVWRFLRPRRQVGH